MQQLTPAQLLSIAQKTHEESCTAGHMIIRQGDAGDSFFIIDSGSVDVLIARDAQLREPELIRRLSAGDFFGERALITGEPRSASIVASTNVVLFRLAKADFHAALAASDSFHQQLRKIAFQC